MKQSTLVSEEELLRQGVELLMEKLGAVEATRFLSLVSTGRMESVRRHRTWQAALDQKRFLDDVFGHR